MAGLRTTIDDRQLLRRLDAVEQGLADATPLMRVWGEIAHASITRNFEVGGRPKRWRKLSPKTIKGKGHSRILIQTGNLSRIVVQPHRTSLQVGTSPATKDYAAIHQFGGKAGRGKKVPIPQRQFLLLQKADLDDFKIETRHYLKRISRA